MSSSAYTATLSLPVLGGHLGGSYAFSGHSWVMQSPAVTSSLQASSQIHNNSVEGNLPWGRPLALTGPLPFSWAASEPSRLTAGLVGQARPRFTGAVSAHGALQVFKADSYPLEKGKPSSTSACRRPEIPSPSAAESALWGAFSLGRHLSSKYLPNIKLLFTKYSADNLLNARTPPSV